MHTTRIHNFGGPKVLAVRIGGQACINVYRLVERNMASFYIKYGSMILSVQKFWQLELAVQACINILLRGMWLVSGGSSRWYY